MPPNMSTGIGYKLWEQRDPAQSNQIPGIYTDIYTIQCLIGQLGAVQPVPVRISTLSTLS